MRLQNLYLRNFRNYSSLTLELDAGLTVFVGDNGQGKTNLLEAVHLLATTRTKRSIQDKDLINWDAFAENLPTQIKALVSTDQEIKPLVADLIQPAITTNNPQTSQKSGKVQKRFSVHGISKPASQYLGSLYAVMFDADDLNLISGTPSARRHFLDLLLCQINPDYLRSLSAYSKVLSQRNELLKRISQGLAQSKELLFWDQQLADYGAILIGVRTENTSELSRSIESFYQSLSGDSSTVILRYSTKVTASDASPENLRDRFRELLTDELPRQIALGATHIGPHRDDLLVFHQEQPMGPHSSRGEQRTAAIALRLSEAKLIETTTLNRPVILLDDVFSELDIHRQSSLMNELTQYDQVLLTTNDYDKNGEHTASVLKIHSGRIVEL